ncbi:seipin-1 [Cynara cardunculus var. scolymus]|uniref:Adipose-regulatory protein, Seipin n=1 Tax=Cynara cardunculus var. scolymus TaxID=59895 RepID=A0A118K4J7_CYNCS|nr:seipin-1 [Cynara cardunculus var. scolymus]KVI07547.1 Adipose-regulatory protein, Seipin [Cynara cardunculus var. scolymus]
MNSPEHHRDHHPKPWFIKLLSLQSDIISDCLLSLTSPFFSITSFTSASHHSAGEPKEPIDTTISADPSTVVHGSTILLRKAVLGFVGAAYVCLILLMVMVVAVIVGVSLVHMWVEEPVYLQENLYFDYTNDHPFAILSSGFREPDKPRKMVPVGHTCNIRLVFVMPESDYNREIGNFQVIAEALSIDGNVITRASRPCMLRFCSRPIRLMRTFLMSVPLLLGITSEIQTTDVPLLKYKERYVPRTESIKISLVPRAGTPFLPQIYEARIIFSSQLPWLKELVRRWKWTFYVWTSIYVYIMLLVVLVCFFRSIMFPTMQPIHDYQNVDDQEVLPEEPPQGIPARDRPTSDTLKRWRQSRSKRKAMLLGGGLPEATTGSDATSMSVTRDEDASVATEEVGDSESVCQ